MGAPWSGDLLMSKPIFSDPFVFRGVRRNRQSFLQSIAAQSLCWACLSLVAYRLATGGVLGSSFSAAGLSALSTADILLAAMAGFASVPLLLLYLAAGAQRCRDCGVTGWAALVLLIPPLNIPMLIALALCPGQEGANKYGDNPLKRTDVGTRFDAMLDAKPLQE